MELRNRVKPKGDKNVISTIPVVKNSIAKPFCLTDTMSLFLNNIVLTNCTNKPVVLGSTPTTSISLTKEQLWYKYMDSFYQKNDDKELPIFVIDSDIDTFDIKLHTIWLKEKLYSETVEECSKMFSLKFRNNDLEDYYMSFIQKIGIGKVIQKYFNNIQLVGYGVGKYIEEYFRNEFTLVELISIFINIKTIYNYKNALYNSIDDEDILGMYNLSMKKILKTRNSEWYEIPFTPLNTPVNTHVSSRSLLTLKNVCDLVEYIPNEILLKHCLSFETIKSVQYYEMFLDKKIDSALHVIDVLPEETSIGNFIHLHNHNVHNIIIPDYEIHNKKELIKANLTKYFSNPNNGSYSGSYSMIFIHVNSHSMEITSFLEEILDELPNIQVCSYDFIHQQKLLKKI